MKEIIIKVKGLMCEGCENRIKNSLNTIDGVETVYANYKEGIVKITLRELVEKNILEDRINDLGFEVVKE